MAEDRYAIVQAAELLNLPAGSEAKGKRRLLNEFLRNPFLDDDAQGLALRAGLAEAETAALIAGLCQEGLLKTAGRRGYMLDLAAVRAGAAAVPPPQAGVLGGEPQAGEVPVGIVLLRADGQPELVNPQAAAWLAVPAEGLDAATFEAVTGVDPRLVLGGMPQVSTVLPRPQPLQAVMYACSLAGEPGVLVVLQDTAVQAEMTRIHARVQEELFARLQGEVVAPVLLIQRFLENPNAKGLGQARAALEQINRFLEEFALHSQAGRETAGV
jgi:hypothetical protein